MKRFFATFGTEHPFGDKVVMMIAEDMEVARAYMFQEFGPKFCSVYDADCPNHGWMEQVQKFGYRIGATMRITQDEYDYKKIYGTRVS